MNDKITTQCPACNAKLAVASQHAGKKLKCPKCGTASVISVGSQLRRTEPPAIPVQDSSTGSSVVPAQRPLIIGGIVTGVVLMLVVMIGIWTNLNDAEQQTASEPPVDKAETEEPADGIAPNDVEPLAKEPKPAPVVPDHEDQWREVFDKLHREINESRTAMLQEATPLRNSLNAWVGEMRTGAKSFPRQELEVKITEASRQIELLATQSDLSCANSIKAYVKALNDLHIPDSVTEQFEQETITKAILAIQKPTDPNAKVAERFEEGGPTVLQSRRGRMWVMFGVRVEL